MDKNENIDKLENGDEGGGGGREYNNINNGKWEESHKMWLKSWWFVLFTTPHSHPHILKKNKDPCYYRWITFAFGCILILAIITILVMFTQRDILKNKDVLSSDIENNSESGDSMNNFIDLNNSSINSKDRKKSSSSSSSTTSSQSPNNFNKKKRKKINDREISRMSWNFLNRNKFDSSKNDIPQPTSPASPSSPNITNSSAADSTSAIILHSKMVYSATGPKNVLKSEGLEKESNNSDLKHCCRTQKYTQVLKRKGCQTHTIINKICEGFCVNLSIPDLGFFSYPVCRPSKSTIKTVHLICGKNGARRRRVKIEKVLRCSCY